jgi:hypothetical protein
MITRTAITLPDHDPPKMAFAASENGVVEVATRAVGTMPNTA